jgi:phage terminase large subunit GpA-like protein
VQSDLTEDQLLFLDQQFGALTTRMVFKTPSEWAESERYLPQAAAAMPGPFRFAVTPYWQEVVDCLSVTSPVREVAVMKGAQVGFTTAVLENFIGYSIAHVKTAAMMYVTSDDSLAKLASTSSIIPMLEESGLAHLIQSSDIGNSREDWQDSQKARVGWRRALLPNGAKSPNKFRSSRSGSCAGTRSTPGRSSSEKTATR